MSDIGTIHWDACDLCKHFRRDVGGCNPLDECDPDDIITLDLIFETVNCTRFEEEPSNV
ncbi:MAG: hypothetical protein KGP14_06880 [Betaproteobacteria bacterium]|jgi:hypothetical protein|nr:hypothetical protein [Betaproteobacteria bacterium]